MPRVRLFHWKADEAASLIEDLRAAGYEVEYPGERANGQFRSIRESPPHALVIDLTRQTSHGRYVAKAIRSQKSIRSIPIVFVDGDPEKVAKIREELPDALYCSRARLPATLKRAKPIANPATPPPMMWQYGTRTAAQKLGIREGTRVAVIDPPPGYAKTVGVMPANASLEEDPEEALPVTLWFIHHPDRYLANLPRMRALAAAKSRLWVVWPKAGTQKAAKTGITQYLVRQAALEFGLVDYKICSLNETWSGMLFTLKK
jgi:hypothetical protein